MRDVGGWSGLTERLAATATQAGFGVVMLFFGRRGTSTVRSASESVEGRAIEQMKRDRGLESDSPR